MKIDLVELFTELALITISTLALGFLVYVLYDAHIVTCEVQRIRSMH